MDILIDACPTLVHKWRQKSSRKDHQCDQQSR